MEKVTCSHESSVLERLNIYMISASKCIKWNQLKESARKFEVLKALNKRLPIQLQIRETRLKMKLNAPRSRFGNFLDKFKDLIRPIYEGKMDTAERVHLTPLDPVNVAPSESEFRRVYQETRRGGKKKRKHYISSDESERGRSSKSYRRGSRSSSPRGYRGRSSHGRYTPQNNQSCYRHRNKRCKKSNHRQPKPCNSFLAPTAPGDEYERSKRNPTRRLDVSVRRAGRKNIAAQMRASLCYTGMHEWWILSKTNCFADSTATVRRLMWEELGKLSEVYDMIAVEVNLTLILDKNFNLTKRGYAFAETVKILDKGAGGNLTIISYFVFTKDPDLQKLRCNKSKDVQFLTGLKLSRLYLAAIAGKLTGADACVTFLPPMDVVPIQGTELRMSTPRRLGRGKEEFRKKKLDGIVEKDMAKKVQHAIYRLVVFAVHKKNNAWRMVFDRLAITDCAEKYFNLMTTYGIFWFQLASMGYHSIPVCSHQRMVDHIVAYNYNKEGNRIVQWIDNTLIHAKDFKGYVKILHKVLQNLREWKVRISPTKSILFTPGIEYSGKILQNVGWNFSKKCYKKILLIPKPEYVYELEKLLHLVQ
eukprot:augustus_masked-scaffold_66-processed-gene-0.98-mRNA-1 protein AED:1.00 eAED:1.00 QI:0/0/0/0/1/1/6/0/588